MGGTFTTTILLCVGVSLLGKSCFQIGEVGVADILLRAEAVDSDYLSMDYSCPGVSGMIAGFVKDRQTITAYIQKRPHVL